jgi:hypothetical protein
VKSESEQGTHPVDEADDEEDDNDGDRAGDPVQHLGLAPLRVLRLLLGLRRSRSRTAALLLLLAAPVVARAVRKVGRGSVLRAAAAVGVGFAVGVVVRRRRRLGVGVGVGRLVALALRAGGACQLEPGRW